MRKVSYEGIEGSQQGQSRLNKQVQTDGFEIVLIGSWCVLVSPEPLCSAARVLCFASTSILCDKAFLMYCFVYYVPSLPGLFDACCISASAVCRKLS